MNIERPHSLDRSVKRGSIRSIREPRQNESYIEKPDENIRWNVSEGVQPWGMPEWHIKIVKDLVSSGEELFDLENHYRINDTSQASKNILSIYNLEKKADSNPEPVVFIDGKGSHGILEKSLRLLKLPPTKSLVIGVGPFFPEVIGFVLDYRNKDSSQGQMSYSVASSRLQEKDSPSRTIKEAIRQRINRPKIKSVAFYLTVYNAFTGVDYPNEDIEELFEVADQSGQDVVLLDIALGEGRPGNKDLAKLVSKYKSVAMIGSLSKAYGWPGGRIGYAIMSEELGKRYANITKEESTPVMTAYQELIVNKITDPKLYVPWIQEINSKIETNKIITMREFDRRKINYLPTSTSSAVIDVLGASSSFYNDLINQGIKGVPGRKFKDTHPNISNNHVRLTILKDPDEIPEFADAVAWAL